MNSDSGGSVSLSRRWLRRGVFGILAMLMDVPLSRYETAVLGCLCVRFDVQRTISNVWSYLGGLVPVRFAYIEAYGGPLPDAVRDAGATCCWLGDKGCRGGHEEGNVEP